jgi:hypothetical protein
MKELQKAMAFGSSEQLLLYFQGLDRICSVSPDSIVPNSIDVKVGSHDEN